MSLPVVLTPEAAADFDEAVNWYQEKRRLGVALTAGVREVIQRIAAMLLIHQIVFQDIRRGVVKRFPYSVFYRVETNRITVIAIFNDRVIRPSGSRACDCFASRE